jgi:hypothetical protein
MRKAIFGVKATPLQPCVQIDLDSLFKYAPSGHPGDEIARIASP